MIKVSIIIPTYNVEKYIEKCLDSAINQTLKEIEIICIDDCSNDKTLSIIETYAKKDSRVKVISLKENGGVSKARNVGIDLAQGEYIGFIDSDDWVDLDFYEKLYNRAKETGAEVIKGDLYGKNKSEYETNKKLEENKFLFSSGFFTAIYKNDFIKSRNIKFPENVRTSEVPVFILDVVLNCNKISIVSETYYHYLIRKDSKVRTFDDDKFKSYLDGVSIIIQKLNNSSLEKDICIKLLEERAILELFTRCYLAKIEKKQLKKRYLILTNILSEQFSNNYKFDFNRGYNRIYNQNYYNNIFERIFSVKNTKDGCCITLLGIKIKFKNRGKNA